MDLFVSEELLESLQKATSMEGVETVMNNAGKIPMCKPNTTPEKDLLKILTKIIEAFNIMGSNPHGDGVCGFHRARGDCEAGVCRFELANQVFLQTISQDGCKLRGYIGHLESNIQIFNGGVITMPAEYIISKEQQNALNAATTLYEINILVTAIKNQPAVGASSIKTQMTKHIRSSLTVLQNIRNGLGTCYIYDGYNGGCSIRCPFNNNAKFNSNSYGCGLSDFITNTKKKLIEIEISSEG